MTCSSRYGICIPTLDISEKLALTIFDRLDEISSLNQVNKFGMDIKTEVVERKFIFFKQGRIAHRYVGVDRSDCAFTEKAVRQYLKSGYISLWRVDGAMNKALLTDECVAKNKQLWTPEDVSVSHGKMSFDLEEEVPEITGIKIAIWGYGYFFPYTMNQVTHAIEGFSLWDALVGVGKEIASQVVVTEINETFSDAGFIRRIEKSGLYSFADQSF